MKTKEIASSAFMTGLFTYGSVMSYVVHTAFMDSHRKSAAAQKITNVFHIQQRMFVRALPGAAMMTFFSVNYVIGMGIIWGMFPERRKV
jgi:hypothetical protein